MRESWRGKGGKSWYIRSIFPPARTHFNDFFFDLIFLVDCSKLGDDILEKPFWLKLVIGDLQGLPEVFFTRAPTAKDVKPLLSRPSLSYCFCVVMLYLILRWISISESEKRIQKKTLPPTRGPINLQLALKSKGLWVL
jgi:hypothetical protein